MNKSPLVEHETTPNCWCKPTLDKNAVGQVWIHNETTPDDTANIDPPPPE
jgi:hypothetical protein